MVGSSTNNSMINIIQKYGNLPFIWGVNDCCLFSANILHEVRNIDYAQDLRGKYFSKQQAYKLLDEVYSTNNLMQVVSIILGKEMKENFIEVSPGNIVCFDNKDNTYSIGVNFGARSYFISEEKGLVAVPNRICKGFWNT